MTVEITRCPECGSFIFTQDPEDKDKWLCMECNHRFPKEVDYDNSGWKFKFTSSEEDDLDEEMEEDGLIGEELFGDNW